MSLENGITLYSQEYTKKLLLHRLSTLGVPAVLVESKLNLLVDQIYADGLVLGRVDGIDNRAYNLAAFEAGKKVEIPVNYGAKFKNA